MNRVCCWWVAFDEVVTSTADLEGVDTLLLCVAKRGGGTLSLTPTNTRLGEVDWSGMVGPEVGGDDDRLAVVGAEDSTDPIELHELSEANAELDPIDLGEPCWASFRDGCCGVIAGRRDEVYEDDSRFAVCGLAGVLVDAFDEEEPKGRVVPPALLGRALPLPLSPKKRDMVEAVNGRWKGLEVDVDESLALLGKANVTVCLVELLVDGPAYELLRVLPEVNALLSA